jgi:hypothetical protein
MAQLRRELEHEAVVDPVEPDRELEADERLAELGVQLVRAPHAGRGRRHVRVHAQRARQRVGDARADRALCVHGDAREAGRHRGRAAAQLGPAFIGVGHGIVRTAGGMVASHSWTLTRLSPC